MPTRRGARLAQGTKSLLIADRFEYPLIVSQTPVIAECVREMRSWIMTGILIPGQNLVEADLCHRLRASRASIREALRVLASEQLVVLIPNRGPFVATLRLKDIEDIHDVWAMLTGKAVVLCAATASTELVQRLDRIVKDVSRVTRESDPLEQLEVTNLFFGTIMGSCNNRVLQESAYALVSRINFIRVQAHKDPDWAQESARGIAEIAKRIKQRQPQPARAALDRHIDLACAAAKRAVLEEHVTSADNRR